MTGDGGRLIVLLPDSHHAGQHGRALVSVTQFIGAAHPDEVCILGDFLDCKAPARWSRGRAEEFANDLLGEAAAGRATLAALRGVYDGRVTFLRGNHEARIATYANSYAPAVAGLVRDYPELLDFAGFDVELKPQPYGIAPGVKAIHGNKLSQVAGMSAQKEVDRHGYSIVQGHSHRLGVIYGTKDRTRFALECGWLGDVRKADYLEFGGVANWQLGFGLLRVSGSRVSPLPVPVFADGSFTVDGQWFGRVAA